MCGNYTPASQNGNRDDIKKRHPNVFSTLPSPEIEEKKKQKNVTKQCADSTPDNNDQGYRDYLKKSAPA